MLLRSLGFSCALVLSAFARCLAQQPPGPATLDSLVKPEEAQKAAAESAGPARPAGTLVRPKDGVQHPDLDKAWAVYEAAVDKAAEGIRTTIATQFEKASADGNLSAVKKWKAAGDAFDKAGTIPVEKETAKDVKEAIEALARASEGVKKAYDETIKALTKQAVRDMTMIVEAEKVEDEWQRLAAGAPVVDKFGQRGLLGEYFSDGLMQKRVRAQVDRKMSFDWGVGSPEGLPKDKFSVRWSGAIEPPRSGPYTFTGVSDDGCRIFIDGRVIFNDWHGRFGGWQSAPIRLTEGRRHRIVIEYFEWAKAANFTLEWIRPDGVQELVPQEFLTPSVER